MRSERKLPPRSLEFIVLVLCLSTHTGLLAYNATHHSPTPDEIAHLAAGLSHWQTGEFSLYRVNPPLARLIATLPIFLFAPEVGDCLKFYEDPGDFGRTEFLAGRQIMSFLGGEKYFNWLLICRASSIIFSILGAVICYLWARSLYGNWAGILTVALWCFSPTFLAFGCILTPDVPSATASVLVMYMGWRWMKSYLWSEALGVALAVAFAVLIKTTCVVLPIVIVFLSLCKSLSVSMRAFRLCFAQTCMMLFVAWLFFMACYNFQGAFSRLGDYRFRSQALSGTSNGQWGNRFHGTCFANLPVPLPDPFVKGLDWQKAEIDPGKKLAYLRGSFSDQGWWYYYLYVIGVKTTVGTQMLFTLTLLSRRCLVSKFQFADACVLLPAIAVLLLLSWHTGMNKHSRYVCPILPFVFVWTGQLVCIFQSTVGRSLVTVIFATSIVSSLGAFPHSMSYFNELVGGPEQGRYHLLSSNVDWAQDLYFLKKEMDSRNWKKVGLVCSANYDVRLLGIDFFLPPTLSELSNRHRQLPTGPYAVSTSIIQGYSQLMPDGSGGWGGNEKSGYTYFNGFTPVGRVGYSILLFELTADDVQQLERHKEATLDSATVD